MSQIIFEKDFSRHPLHYFFLLCFQLVGLWGLLWFNYRPVTQLLILFYMAFSYVMWGIYHHKAHRDLHLKIILEYILVAILGLLLFSTLVFSS